MNEALPVCIEICAGAGGQALGLERAGFRHAALVEIEAEYCAVLKLNRPEWNVIHQDVRNFDGRPYAGIDLLAGGVPCPPFSAAGALRLVREIMPKAVMLENVRGFLGKAFADYRTRIFTELESLGYTVHVKLLDASRFGVPQKRLRVVVAAIRNDQNTLFSFPEGRDDFVSVGEALRDLAASNGWKGAEEWAELADKAAPANTAVRISDQLGQKKRGH